MERFQMFVESTADSAKRGNGINPFKRIFAEDHDSFSSVQEIVSSQDSRLDTLRKIRHVVADRRTEFAKVAGSVLGSTDLSDAEEEKLAESIAVGVGKSAMAPVNKAQAAMLGKGGIFCTLTSKNTELKKLDTFLFLFRTSLFL